jgi:hypothetical protein
MTVPDRLRGDRLADGKAALRRLSEFENNM